MSREGASGRRGTPGYRLTGPAMVLAVAVAAVAVAVLLGAATLVGEPVRRAALLHLDETPPSGSVRLADASPLAAGFFAGRDTVRVTVPWDMTGGEFLALYHLENNRSARVALRDQLGVVEPGDPLRQGATVTFVLTAREGGP